MGWSPSADQHASDLVRRAANILYVEAERVARSTGADSVGKGHVEAAADSLRVLGQRRREAWPGVLADAGWALIGLAGGGMISIQFADITPVAVVWACAGLGLVGVALASVGVTRQLSRS